MTDQATFLAAIVAAPDDDLPRLVYADWLDEHGETRRAEFIRLQCRLALGCKVCDGTGRNVISACPCSLLRSRERELLNGVMGLGVDALPVVSNLTRTSFAPGGGMGWCGPDGSSDSYISAHFSRGFVSRISLTWHSWVTHANSLTKVCPLAGKKDCEIKLTDVQEPMTSQYEEGRVAWFHPLVPRSPPERRSHRLPIKVFNALDSFDNRGANPTSVKWYNGITTACNALSRSLQKLWPELARSIRFDVRFSQDPRMNAEPRWVEL